MTSSSCGQKEKITLKLSYITYIISIHPTIKFTHEYSNSLHQSLPFLDVQVHLNNQIETDLRTKPTDKHQYLLKTSCHPAHTKRTIPFSLYVTSAPVTIRFKTFSSVYHHQKRYCSCFQETN